MIESERVAIVPNDYQVEVSTTTDNFSIIESVPHILDVKTKQAIVGGFGISFHILLILKIDVHPSFSQTILRVESKTLKNVNDFMINNEHDVNYEILMPSSFYDIMITIELFAIKLTMLLLLSEFSELFLHRKSIDVSILIKCDYISSSFDGFKNIVYLLEEEVVVNDHLNRSAI